MPSPAVVDPAGISSNLFAQAGPCVSSINKPTQTRMKVFPASRPKENEDRLR